MLKKLYIENFKAFSKFSVKFNDFNLLIGQNNNGKSTLIDALKLVSIISSYKVFHNPLSIEFQNVEVEGFMLHDDKIPFLLHNLRNEYNEDEDTIIKASFSDEIVITVFFPANDKRCYFFFEIKGINISKSITLRNSLTQRLGVIPPLGKFDENEEILSEKHVMNSYGGYLTSRHFRNFWYLDDSGFDIFSKDLSETWENIEIEKPKISVGKITMFFKENRITREISWAGTGLMIWMQLLTHICKLEDLSTIVIDEPDIYLHSDLQRKLISLLEKKSSQIILTTHSVELINEVSPDQITYIDKNLKKSENLQDISQVQFYLNQLGSAQNIQIAKIIKSKKCLFVEGNDFKYLRNVAKKLGNDNFYEENNFSVIKLEGFSNAERLKDSNWYFENIIGEEISSFVILDRDYYSEEELKNVKDSFEKNKLEYHIWNKKELENFFLDVDVLFKVFDIQLKKRGMVIPPQDEFINLLKDISHTFHSQIFSQTQYHKYKNKKLDPKEMKLFTEEFNKNWEKLDFRLNVIGGKDFFTALNRNLNELYKISITIPNLIFFMSKEEFNKELIEVIERISSLFNLNE